MHPGRDPLLPNQPHFVHSSEWSSEELIHEGVNPPPNTRMGSPEDMREGDYGTEKQACLQHKGKGPEERDMMSSVT